MASIAAIGLSPFWVRAADATWTYGGDGSWSDASNWLGGLPADGASVSIINNDSINRTINYDYGGTSIQFGTLSVSNSGSGMAVLSQSANTLNVGTELIGSAGAGFLNVSGGTHNIGTTQGDGYLSLGLTSGAAGTLMLSGNGIINAFGVELIGFSGAGTFIQSGGTHNLGSGTIPSDNYLILGSNDGSSGTYQLSGDGIINATAIEEIGQASDSVFIQSGGTHNLGVLNVQHGTLSLGHDFGRGAYALSGTSSLTVWGHENIGDRGSGTFIHSGGVNSLVGLSELNIGNIIDSAGTYLLSGSGELDIQGFEFVGHDGIGTLNQSGGVNPTFARGWSETGF